MLRIPHNQNVDLKDRLQQPIKYRLTEPAAVPWSSGSADDHVRNAVFSGKSGDGCDDIVSLERHLRPTQSMDQREIVTDLSLSCRRDARHVFAGRLDVNCIPRSADTIRQSSRFAEQLFDIRPARTEAGHDTCRTGRGRRRLGFVPTLVQPVGDLLQCKLAQLCEIGRCEEALQSVVNSLCRIVEGAIRQRTPNEIALSLVLSAFTLIFLIVTASLWSMALNAETYMQSYLGLPEPVKSLGTDIPTLVALLVCLIPTTIGGLLAAIGIAGMDRALRANILAKSGKAVEVAGDIDTLLLDKTGTITIGNRRATQFIPVHGFTAAELGRLATLASIADQTPEGKSIVELYRQVSVNGDANHLDATVPADANFVAFTAQTRMSGLNLPDGKMIRKGAADAVFRHVKQSNGQVPDRLQQQIDEVASRGATPLLVCEGNRIAGLIVLEDILKPGIKERFERLRRMGLRTVMVTGDNPLTAKAIAEQAGVDTYIAEATPEAKLEYIRQEQAAGKLVAMMGDGTNDAPALAQADVGVAMNSGTQAAKEAGNMVDLDSDPTKLLEVVEIGKQLLMTRGALTTFSIANDLAKYFAIVPALFAGTLPWLKVFDVMGLHSPTSAILSAVIFNAIIIPLLIPIALRGVTYRPVGADALLRRNLLVWGLGGVIVPFVGIKLIDLVLVTMHLA
ncbi:MAG: kdpB [Schlesneria sp.]|nr:kdpB [Schlesneria sp.]